MGGTRLSAVLDEIKGDVLVRGRVFQLCENGLNFRGTSTMRGLPPAWVERDELDLRVINAYRQLDGVR